MPRAPPSMSQASFSRLSRMSRFHHLPNGSSSLPSVVLVQRISPPQCGGSARDVTSHTAGVASCRVSPRPDRLSSHGAPRSQTRLPEARFACIPGSLATGIPWFSCSRRIQGRPLGQEVAVPSQDSSRPLRPISQDSLWAFVPLHAPAFPAPRLTLLPVL